MKHKNNLQSKHDFNMTFKLGMSQYHSLHSVLAVLVDISRSNYKCHFNLLNYFEKWFYWHQSSFLSLKQ